MSRFVRGTAAGALLFVLATGFAFAQQQSPALDPERLAAARELMTAQGGIEQARKGLIQTTEAIVAQVRRSNPAEADELAAFLKAYVGPDNPKVTLFFEGVLEDSIAFYAERCTVEEIKAMTAFLSTPAGRKLTSLAPEAASAVAPRFVAFQQGLQRDVQAAIAKGQLGKKQ